MGKNKFDYKKKSNRLAIAGIVARVLDPSGIISDVLFGFAAANAAADLYWHPGDYSELIENSMPMPCEAMTEEETKEFWEHDEKTQKLKEKETQKGGNGDVKKSIQKEK